VLGVDWREVLVEAARIRRGGNEKLAHGLDGYVPLWKTFVRTRSKCAVLFKLITVY
jgi:hypothetical protein